MQKVCTGEDLDTEFNRIECMWVGCWYFESVMYFSLINIATAISKEDISLSGSWFYCLSNRAAQCMFSAPSDWLTSMQRNYQAEMIKTSLNGTELWGMRMFNYTMCFFLFFDKSAENLMEPQCILPHNYFFFFRDMGFRFIFVPPY